MTSEFSEHRTDAPPKCICSKDICLTLPDLVLCLKNSSLYIKLIEKVPN